MYPLKHQSGEIAAIEIRRPRADQVIRWSAYQISSVLALLSELCGLPERLLRQLPTHDFDRVMLALGQVLPASIKAEMDEGKRLLATPDEELPPEKMTPVLDQQDPRFPAVAGPVVRLSEKKPAAPPEDKPIDFGPPQVSEVVR